MAPEVHSDSLDVNEIRVAMSKIDLSLTWTYTRHVTSELIADFARVSGDDAPLHLDADHAATNMFGRPIAHGALLVGFMSGAQTLLCESVEPQVGRSSVSLGYDRVRFTAPVFAGDNVATSIRIVELQPEKLRLVCHLECRNDDGQVVAAASHIMRFI